MSDDAKDAARYRWLRGRFDDCAAALSFAPVNAPLGDGWVTVEQCNEAGEKLDDAIDAAMKGGRP